VYKNDCDIKVHFRRSSNNEILIKSNQTQLNHYSNQMQMYSNTGI